VSDRVRVSRDGRRWSLFRTTTYIRLYRKSNNTGPVSGLYCAECEITSLLCCHALLISLVSFKGKLSSDLINHSEIFQFSGTGRHGLGSAKYPRAR
jgi:hypothetical protein